VLSVLLSFISSLAVALSLAHSDSPPGRIALDVPYVTQTELLCGGAAAAMVFRYWGDAHAGVAPFAALVDHQAGGITTTKLAAAVRERGWNAEEFAGSIAWLSDELARGRPAIVLLAERRSRFHYVVVSAIDADAVWVHDPAWGASRRIAANEFLRRWEPTGFWSMRILPGGAPLKIGLRPDTTTATVSQAATTPHPSDECESLLTAAIDDVRRRGLEVADSVFGGVRASCPGSAGPLRELAAVRFAQRQWKEAVDLAERAAWLDPHDSYTWDVLGSSRFVLNDVIGALDAWNHLGKPRVDSIRIEGLRRTRHSVLAEALGVPPDTLLTPQLFRLAERRLEELPDRAAARIAFRPETDGFATVDVGITERATRPQGSSEWAAEAARTIVDREVTVTTAGARGQGEIWTASWRWWNGRPRAAIAFSAPKTGAFPGIWRVDASWETQTYAARNANRSALFRQEAMHGGLTVSNWLTPGVRYELRAGLDSWSDVGRRAASAGGAIERRLLSDRFSISANATKWLAVTRSTGAGGFHAEEARATFKSSPAISGVTYAAVSGAQWVSATAPLALWPGAGDGRAREPLLRAHPLLHDGIVSGSIFGRQLTYTTFELHRWLEPRSLVRFAIAGFVDAAQAGRRAAATPGYPLQIDAGVGVRIKIPGRDGVMRVDAARGLRDGTHAITVGWSR
jgi:Peptidase C39 family